MLTEKEDEGPVRSELRRETRKDLLERWSYLCFFPRFSEIGADIAKNE